MPELTREVPSSRLIIRLCLVNKVEEKTASKSPETDLQVSLYTGFRMHLFACIGLCPPHLYSCAQDVYN